MRKKFISIAALIGGLLILFGPWIFGQPEIRAQVQDQPASQIEQLNAQLQQAVAERDQLISKQALAIEKLSQENADYRNAIIEFRNEFSKPTTVAELDTLRKKYNIKIPAKKEDKK